MTIKLKKNLIFAMIATFCACAIAFCVNVGTVKTKAEEPTIDYSELEYVLFSESITGNLATHEGFYNHMFIPGIDYVNKYVFKIDCPDLSADYPELTESQLVEQKYIYLDFEGSYLYFVNGKAKSNNDVLPGYVDILQYDEINNQVYVRFGFDYRTNSYYKLVQNDREAGSMYYTKISDILSQEDFYFDINVRTGNGLRKKTNSTIFSIDMKLVINRTEVDVVFGFESLTLSIIEGQEHYVLLNEELSQIDGIESEDTIFWEVFVLADNINLEQHVVVQAELVYDGQTYIAQSPRRSLIGLWQNLYDSIFGDTISEESRYYHDYEYTDIRKVQML